VLLPVYNGGLALRFAVCSLLQQTLADWELLLVDDGSTDGCPEQIARLANRRIRVLGGKEKRGLAQRLNEGIATARGAYIARMDHDDLAFPRRLEAQADFLDAYADVDLIGCRAIAFRDNGSLIGMLPFRSTHEKICAQVWRGFDLPHPTWMGRAAWFRRFRYRVPEVIRAEDQDLLLRAYSSSRFACHPEPLLAYRVASVSLPNVFKARMSLAGALVREHARAGRYHYAALGAVISAVRPIADAMRVLAALPLPSHRNISPVIEPSVRSAWSELWSQTEKCARRMFENTRTA
jgi:glycosyltransferase involved in cell wall biosynthesis